MKTQEITQKDGTTHINMVDDEDAWALEKYNWWVSKEGNTFYVGTHIRVNGKWTTLKLHRLLMGLDFGDKRVIDHVNGAGTDNRRCNLRICTRQENARNHQTNSKNTSGMSGIHYLKSNNKWRVRIKVNYKDIHLGSFQNKEDAIKITKRSGAEIFWRFCLQGLNVIYQS